MTSSGGFTLRKVFYTVPSRLIGPRLRVRLYDVRLELLLGATLLMTLEHGRSGVDGKHSHVADYHHVIHALRRKPMSLLSLVYRDQLFPREAYRRACDFLREALTDRAACRLMVALLSLAHDRSCEAQLASLQDDDLDHRRLPDINALLARFAPEPARLPEADVHLVSLNSYDVLVESLAGLVA